MPAATNGRPTFDIGSVWTCVRGPHKGNTAAIVSITPTSVKIRQSGTGTSWGRNKNDQGRINTVARDVFLTNYTPPLPVKARVKPPAPAGQPSLGLIPRGLNFEILDITPEQATAWLANGGANRKLDGRRVNRFVITMQRGEWQLTGDSIKLDEYGRVRDGQHRLAAIAQSGMTVKSLVVRGVGEAAFDVIDTGRARTVANVLEIHGKASTTSIAAAIRCLILIERFGSIGQGTDEERSAATPPACLAYLDKHPEIYEAHSICEPVRKVLYGGAGLWTAMFTLFWRIDPAAAFEFSTQLATGAGLEADAPALKLRNRTLGKASRGPLSNLNREDLSIIIAKSWNAYRRGEKVGQLRAGENEKLPELV